MYKMIPTNEVIVEVYPEQYSGWFNREEKSADRMYQDAKEIESNIKRHVDGVDSIHIIQKHKYQDKETGNTYDSLYEMLEDKYAEDNLEYYSFAYKRPSDNGVGTRSYAKSFRELIEEAYRNPFDFNLIKECSSRLTEEKEKFLNKVIEESLKLQTQKA